MSIEAMKQALEALEEFCQYANDQHQMNALTEDSWLWMMWKDGLKAITSLHQAIEQAEKQDRDEYERGFIDGMQKQMQSSVDKAVNAMSKREWVGLTEEEVERIKLDGRDLEFVSMTALHRFARDIQAKLKDKNT